MNKILTSILLGASLLVAVPAQARDHRWGVDSNRHSPYHNSHRHHNHGNKWIGPLIGGVILGTVITSRSAQAESVPVIVQPMPEPYVAKTCTIREVYDQYNRLISRERFCN